MIVNIYALYQTDAENSGELTLHDITHDDEGWYSCVVANSLGSTAASAYLHVIDGEFVYSLFF